MIDSERIWRKLETLIEKSERGESGLGERMLALARAYAEALDKEARLAS